MKRGLIAFSVALIALLALAPAARADLIVSAGAWNLQPNQAGQEIFVSITGGDALEGATLNVQVGGDAPRPGITGGDIVTDTIFAANNNGAPSYDFSDPSIAYLDVATQTGSVAGSGTLAKLVIDTTGITSGSFGLSLLGTDYGDTAIYLPTGSEASVSFVPGSITIVPEPASLSLLALGSLLLLRRRLGGRA